MSLTFSKQSELKPTGEPEEQQSDPVEVSDHDVFIFLSLCIDWQTEETLRDQLRGEETEILIMLKHIPREYVFYDINRWVDQQNQLQFWEAK